MRGLKGNSGWKKWIEGNWKNAGFFMLPAAVVILILFIVSVDKPTDLKSPDPAAGDRTLATQDMADRPGGQQDETGMDVKQTPVPGELKQDEIPELTALIEAYCHAKEDIDPAALNRVFGREEGGAEEQEAMRIQMEKVSLLVDGYDSVICYYMDGPEPDTYVLYPYFEIYYKDAVMAMPCLTWAYAKKDENGQFYMTQDISGGVKSFISDTGGTEAVKALVEQVKEKAAEAVAGDETLMRIYGNNSSYGDSGASMVEIIAPKDAE